MVRCTSAVAVPTSRRETELACKALEELRQKLQALARMGPLTPSLLQAAADDCSCPVIVADNRAQILMVNGPAARLIGTSTRDLLKLTVWDITHTAYQADFDVLWREFLRAGRQRGRYGVRHNSGDVVEVSYCAEADVLPGRSVVVLNRLDEVTSTAT